MGCIWPPLPLLVRTTKPGRSSARLPRPYHSQLPMLGRPEMVVPVFMKVWAGSWLIASVFIERMMQTSSLTAPRCGKSVAISWPDLPKRVNGWRGPKQLSCWFWSWAIGWPLVNDSGIGLPFISASLGLWSKVSRCEGPPAMVSQMTRFARAGGEAKYLWLRVHVSRDTGVSPVHCQARVRRPCHGAGFSLIPRDRLVQVEDRAGDTCPGREFADVQFLRHGGGAVGDEGLGG